MRLDHETFRLLIDAARLAPSVHNTQPTRWNLTPEGRVRVLEDTSRYLHVGDPEGRDMGVSHGSAVEGFCLAAGMHGWATVIRHPEACIAEIGFETGGKADMLAQFMAQRRTYRGKFVSDGGIDALTRLHPADDLTIVERSDQIAQLASLYDKASLQWFRNRAYRTELTSWMRLSRRHPLWSIDGLNAEAMEMSKLEAAGAGIVLRTGVFEALDGVGLARALVAEASVIRTSAAIALFHRPLGEAPFDTGRRYLRAWLTFTQAGLSACPMAILADEPDTRRVVQASYGIAADRRLITAFRLGVAPGRTWGPRPRLSIDSLIV